MTPLLLLITMSLASGAFDASRKWLSRHLDALPLLVALSLGHAALLGAILGVGGGPAPGPAYAGPAAASIALNIVGNWLFLRAVAASPLSLTVPLLALVPVGSVALGAWLLGEWPSPRQLAGIVTIVLGALVLQAPPGHGARGLLAAMRAEPGVPMMAGVAGCWALVGPFDKLATQASSPVFHGCVLYGGVGLILLPLLLRDTAGLRALARPALWGPLALSCALGTLALVTQLEVITQVLVSLMEAVKRVLGLLLAVATGVIMFKEVVGIRQWGASAVMIGGLALLLL